jgi:AmmeMemoRadiSam system protein B
MMCPTSSIPPDQIRRPVVAGQFYTEDPECLAAEIDGFLERATQEPLPGEVLALIAPHAGYMFSGQVAGYAYRQVRQKSFSSAVVVAPSHRTAFAGASVYHQGGYQTPLGLVPVNAPLASTIMSRWDRLNYYPQAHALEHSLEVQLPFLQRALGQFQLVPVIMGDQDLSTCQMLAGALASALKGENVLLVASSDLSHYHSYDQAVELDKVILEAVKAFDAEKLHRALWDGKGEACGGGPMVTVMLAARMLGADRADVLRYANSGDVTGDRGHVVGYMAAAIYRSPQAAGAS